LPNKREPIVKLVKNYLQERDCHALLERSRWPDGVVCTNCGANSISRFQKNRRAREIFECRICKHQFSLTSQTIFHKSHLSLLKWFTAIWLISISHNIRVETLQANIRTTYKTAWRIRTRITADLGKRTLDHAESSLISEIIKWVSPRMPIYLQKLVAQSIAEAEQ